MFALALLTKPTGRAFHQHEAYRLGHHTPNLPSCHVPFLMCCTDETRMPIDPADGHFCCSETNRKSQEGETSQRQWPCKQ